MKIAVITSAIQSPTERARTAPEAALSRVAKQLNGPSPHASSPDDRRKSKPSSAKSPMETPSISFWTTAH